MVRERSKKSTSKASASKKTLSRKPVERRLPIGRVILLSLCVVGLGFLAEKLEWNHYIQKIDAITSRPVTNIAIEGRYTHVSKQNIEQMIVEKVGGDFIDINLPEMKAHIELHPWISHVKIQRIWPDGLVLKISEHSPIARWGKDSFINQQGDVVQVGDISSLVHLPVLQGDKNKSQEITRKYLDLAAVLSSSYLELTGLYVDNKMSWSLVVNGTIDVVLGQGDIVKKLKDFMWVYNQDLHAKKNQIKRIDARYNNAIAVQWVDDTTLVSSL